MNWLKEVIALGPGSEKLEQIREAVRKGDRVAAKKFVYFCALQKIRRDNSIPPEKKLRIFKEIVESDMIDVEVSING